MPITTESSVQQLSSLIQEAVEQNKDIDIKDNGKIKLKKATQFAADSHKEARLVRLISDAAEKQGIQSLDAFREAVVNGLNSAAKSPAVIGNVTRRASAFMQAINTAEQTLDRGATSASLKDKLGHADIGVHKIPVSPDQLKTAERNIPILSYTSDVWGRGNLLLPQKAPDKFVRDASSDFNYTIQMHGDSIVSNEFIEDGVEKARGKFTLLQTLAKVVTPEGHNKTPAQLNTIHTRSAQALAGVLNSALLSITTERHFEEAMPGLRILRGETLNESGRPYEVTLKPNGSEIEVEVKGSTVARGMKIGRDMSLLGDQDKRGVLNENIKFSLDTRELLNGRIQLVEGSLRVDQSVNITANTSLDARRQVA